MLSQQFELCGVHPDTTVTVLSDELSDPQIKSNSLLALERIGCRTISVALPFSNRETLMERVQSGSASLALSESDLVIDLSQRIGPNDMDEVPLSGVRVLSVDYKGPDGIGNLITSAGAYQRAVKIDGLLNESEYLTISSSFGTQVEFGLNNCSWSLETGIPTHEGSVAKWPSGCVQLFPERVDVDAEIVAMPGDVVLDALHIIKNPVRIQIEKGNIVDIKGESSDANLIRAQLEYGQDPESSYAFRSLILGLSLHADSNFVGPFDSNKIGRRKGAFHAGWVTVTTGSIDNPVLSLTLTNTNVSVDNIVLFSAGELSANLKPDIYELAALQT